MIEEAEEELAIKENVYYPHHEGDYKMGHSHPLQRGLDHSYHQSPSGMMMPIHRIPSPAPKLLEEEEAEDGEEGEVVRSRVNPLLPFTAGGVEAEEGGRRTNSSDSTTPSTTTTRRTLSSSSETNSTISEGRSTPTTDEELFTRALQLSDPQVEKVGTEGERIEEIDPTLLLPTAL